MHELQPLVIYVDIDDTLIRSVGSKRIPVVSAIRHVRDLHAQQAVLYCWSSGGAEYARRSAAEVGLEDCFTVFLPKPDVLLDDQAISEWRRLLHVNPTECPGQTVDAYRQRLRSSGAPAAGPSDEAEGGPHGRPSRGLRDGSPPLSSCDRQFTRESDAT